MKKIFLFTLVIFMVVLTACSNQNNTTTQSDIASDSASVTTPTESTSESPTDDFSQIDNSTAKLSVLVQNYDAENIAEILSISYDTEKADLKEYGGINPEIESFNKTVNFGIVQTYDNFINANGSSDDAWIEIRSYPFTSTDYLQVVTTSCIYPTYGTDGDIYSYNFDLQNNHFMSTDDALTALQLDRDTIANTMREMIPKYYSSEFPNSTVEDVYVAGFLMTPGSSDSFTNLLLQVDVKLDADGEPWTEFFSYLPELDELTELNNECLFDSYDMDQMDPPFYYQQMGGEGSAPSNEDAASSNLMLAFDVNGLEELTPGYDYMYDGMVYYSIDKLLPTEYSQDAVLEQLQRVLDTDIRLTNITEADEYSSLLTYPSWLIVYETGENEDTRECFDVYVQTDVADYLLHSAVPVDFSTDYHDEIFMRYGSMYWVE